jgi:hypothetical protein
MRRIISLVVVALVMAAMMVAIAMPAFAIPGNGKDEKGKHSGYGLEPLHENNGNGDRQHSAIDVEEGLYNGHAYGDFNN